ncbi:MAG: amidohydrolase [Candidatus Marinimicrobia bacterium]|nr:amidohydrolase [Candidatus Neomarinimicrobiota bacterium]
MKYFLFPLLLTPFLLIFNCQKNLSEESVSLAIINARIWTANPNQPWAEAIAVNDNIITYVGSTKEITSKTSKNTIIIDANGMFVAPGFTDSHIHLLEGGFRLSSVQLRDADTPEEFRNRLAEFAKTCEPGDWILCGDWDHSLWGGDLPKRDWIDDVTPDNPVWINRLDGHMALANSLALKLANIDESTVTPSGGTIVRDKQGKPTGILKDNAMELIDPIIGEPSNSLKYQALDAAMQYLLEQGVTAVHHMGSWDDLRIFEHYNKKNKLRIRISAAVPLSTWQRLDEKIKTNGSGKKWLRIGGLKSFVDGSLGSHTALFHEPYCDQPTDTGLLVTSKEDLYQMILNSDASGLQSITHAIGDKANTIIFDIYEKILNENGKRDRRFRIEHVQHLRPTDIPRFRELGVIASVQPYHAIDDGRWAESLIGHDRVQQSYAYNSLLKSGAIVAFGSDWYVAPPVPLLGIYAAVTRQTLDGLNPDGWVPEEKVSVEAALKCYTLHPAYASFEEKIKGSIERGKLADIVIIDHDLTMIEPEEIKNCRIMITIVDGKNNELLL